jgi:hypothetical protein
MSVETPKKKMLPIIYFEQQGNAEEDFSLKKVFEGNVSTLPMEKKKNYISFSELLTWYECKFKHKLKYIDQIALDGPNENTEFGQVIHDILEGYLKTKTLPDFEVQKQLLTELFNKLPKADELKDERELWQETLQPIAEQVPEFMTKTFGDWEYVAAEYEMFEPIKDEDGYFFKGYIDGIIKSGDKIYIIDWKSSKDFWDKNKSKDPKKYIQLVLYKHFFAIKNNIPLENIECGFVVLRRKVTRNNKDRCLYIPVSVEDDQIKEATALIKKFFSSVKKHFYTKNRDSCRFCVYYNTAYCKG